MPERSYLIGELADEFGVTLRTLRFYQDRGLLSPRRQGKTRIYSEAVRTRLARILAAKKLGFTLAEITDMIAKDGGTQSAQLPLTEEQIETQIAYLERQKAEILRALAELGAILVTASERGRNDPKKRMTARASRRVPHPAAIRPWIGTP